MTEKIGTVILLYMNNNRLNINSYNSKSAASLFVVPVVFFTSFIFIYFIEINMFVIDTN